MSFYPSIRLRGSVGLYVVDLPNYNQKILSREAALLAFSEIFTVRRIPMRAEIFLEPGIGSEPGRGSVIAACIAELIVLRM
jgi:hypothetical protein